MTDSQLDETETKILLLIQLLREKMFVDSSPPDLYDQEKVKIFGECLQQVGLRFLNYIATPKEKGQDDA